METLSVGTVLGGESVWTSQSISYVAFGHQKLNEAVTGQNSLRYTASDPCIYRYTSTYVVLSPLGMIRSVNHIHFLVALGGMSPSYSLVPKAAQPVGSITRSSGECTMKNLP